MANTLTTRKKMGRPTLYNQKLVEQICRLIEDGESMRTICERKDMPSRLTFRLWLRTNDEFLSQYTRAKANQADFYADAITEIAKDTLRGVYDPAAARVALDAFKWTSSKLKPRVYGDRIDVTTDGKPLPTPMFAGGAMITLSNTTPDVESNS